MLYITGDTHGEQARFFRWDREKLWGKDDTLLICGDFGFLFRDDRTENGFLDELARRPYTICFVDGNHENFHALNRYPVEIWKGGKVHTIRKTVYHLMRGQVFTLEGKRIFTMGGAYSRDKAQRQEGVSWWPEELPSPGEYHEAAANLARHGNQVDLILTHTAPREIIRRMGCTPDPHDMELTGFLEYIMYETDFRHWYFGHWHRDQVVDERFTAVWFDTHKIP